MKRKFKSAAHAKAARELSASWESLLSKHAARPFGTSGALPVAAHERSIAPKFTPNSHPSLITTQCETFAKRPVKYTGTAIVGIATMHKSNAVPVFSQDEAESISKMRR